MKMRKLFSLLLILCMLLSAVPALAEEAKGDLWIGDYELSYWVPLSFTQAQHYTDLNEHPFFQWMEEQTGVHINFVHPSEEQMQQQFNLMVTNNTFYDMMYNAQYADGYQASIDDGVFLDINQFEEIMPDYFEAVHCDDGSYTAWEWGVEKDLYQVEANASHYKLATTPKGNLWCVTQVITDSYPCENGAIIRQDWLDEADLEAPTTIEELEKVLAAFKARGENVIPMSLGARGVNEASGYLAAAFDLYPYWWTLSGDQVDQQGYTTETFKEYLTLIHKWYDLGYIDPDFMNRNDEGLVSLFLTDRLGIMVDMWHTPGTITELYDGPDKDFAVTALEPVRKTEDQQLHWKLYYDTSPYNYTCITSSCENPEVAAKWLNVLYTREGVLRATYGVEGESYVMEDGVPYYTDWFYNNPDGIIVDDLRELYLMPNFTGLMSTRAMSLSNATVATAKTEVSEWQQTCNIWGSHADYSKVIGTIQTEGNEWNEMYDMFVAAETYAAPMVIKFIIGDESLDEFDAYAQKTLDMGMAEAREIVQKCIDRRPK